MWNSAMLFDDVKLAKGGRSMRSRKPVESLTPTAAKPPLKLD